jgi:hypothetical protein
MEMDNYISLKFMHNIGYTSVRIWQQRESFLERAIAKLTFAFMDRPDLMGRASNSSTWILAHKNKIHPIGSMVFVLYETFSNDCITKWVYRSTRLILYIINEKHTSKLGIKLFKLFQDIYNIGTSFRIEVQYNNRNNSINVPNAIFPRNSSVTNKYIYYITAFSG